LPSEPLDLADGAPLPGSALAGVERARELAGFVALVLEMNGLNVLAFLKKLGFILFYIIEWKL